MPVGRTVSIPDALLPGQDAWSLMGEVVEAMLKKSDRAAASGAAAATVIDVRFKGTYPLLWDHVTQAVWDDGSPRETSGVTFFVQDGVVKVLLKDNDAGLCLWAAGNGVYSAFEALEKLLGSAAADWRLDRKKGGGAAKRR